MQESESDKQYRRKLRQLHSQLNRFGDQDVFLGQFQVLGQLMRRQGGAVYKLCRHEHPIVDTVLPRACVRYAHV